MRPLSLLVSLTFVACALDPQPAAEPEPQLTATPAGLGSRFAPAEADRLAAARPQRLVATRAVIRLDQRAGVGTEGLALTPAVANVPAAQAQVLVSSFDCGARGRWVSLVTSGQATLCASTSAAPPELASCTWTSELEVGGSDVDGTGWTLLVREGDALVGRLQIVSVTPTPFDWYETDRPFDVTVDVLP